MRLDKKQTGGGVILSVRVPRSMVSARAEQCLEEGKNTTSHGGAKF